MAITQSPPASTLLTYEQYMAEGEIKKRYDIIDGVRIYMAAPKWKHQRIQFNTTSLLHQFEETGGMGLTVSAPFDIMIRRKPLRTRQPDVLFISHEQLAKGGGVPDDGPLEVAPELVVEILSDSETERSIGKKPADYVLIGVKEGWLVRPEPRTVEVLRLSPDGPETVAVYRETDFLQSITFPGLTLPVADFFTS